VTTFGISAINGLSTREADMDGVGIFSAVIIGILAGWIAERVLNRKHGLFTNLIVGVVGSFIGAFLAHAIGFRWGGFVGSLVVSTVGAILLLSVLGLLRRR
jgi:uncharacterized membrane protein YeaQ/YmgE (transglycosylase-associated protein family)